MTQSDIEYIKRYYFRFDYCEWMDFWEFADRYGGAILQRREASNDQRRIPRASGHQ